MFFTAIDSIYDNQTITLVENTGIQFLDFKAEIPTKIDHYANPLLRVLELLKNTWVPIPFFAKDVGYAGPVDWARAYITEDIEESSEVIVGAKKSEDVKDDSSDRNSFNKNWRVVLAFDTSTKKAPDSDENIKYFYYSPFNRDVNSQTSFALYDDFSSERFIDFYEGSENSDWVKRWCKHIIKFRTSKYKYLSDCVNYKTDKVYKDFIRFLKDVLVNFNIKLIPYGSNNKNKIEVSLAIDIGNSRTCGLLFENMTLANENKDKLKAYTLKLRDLNRPALCYEGAFDSRLEFCRPLFGESIASGNLNSFNWYSMVRLGEEANFLSSQKTGNDNQTGFVAPKRYLWQTEPSNMEQWFYNNTQREDPTLKENAIDVRLFKWCNSEGVPLFSLSEDDDCLDSMTSRLSESTFTTLMAIEIIQQAISQINSYGHRINTNAVDVPRVLSNIIVTTPTGMPYEERELIRSRINQAAGILWKCLGYDFSSASIFPGDSGKVALIRALEERQNSTFAYNNIAPYVEFPKINVSWNEAESSQVVYIYNELVHVYGGSTTLFINSLRRKNIKDRVGEASSLQYVYELERTSDESRPTFNPDSTNRVSTRIACLDIGGGTTDVVVKDYVYAGQDKDGTEVEIRSVEVFKDGFKIAGDDIVLDLIEMSIVPQILRVLTDKMIDANNGSSIDYKNEARSTLAKILGSSNERPINQKILHINFTQQVLITIAKRVLEMLEVMPDQYTPCEISGTIEQFLEGNFSCTPEPTTAVKVRKYTILDENFRYFNDIVRSAGLSDFDVRKVQLSFNLTDIANKFVQSTSNDKGKTFKLCGPLEKMCEALNVFDCDLVLLAGQPSKMPMIQWFLQQRLSIPMNRILPMHNYKVGSWYPFNKISDPKTTASVGALLSGIRQFDPNENPNFRLNTAPVKVNYETNYIGFQGLYNKISSDAVMYEIKCIDQNHQPAIKFNHSAEVKLFPVNNVSSLNQKQTDATSIFKTTFPCHIAFRKLSDPDWNTLPLFKLQLLTVSKLKVVKNFSKIVKEESAKAYREWINQVLGVDDENTNHSKLNFENTEIGDLIGKLESLLNNNQLYIDAALKGQAEKDIPEVKAIATSMFDSVVLLKSEGITDELLDKIYDEFDLLKEKVSNIAECAVDAIAKLLSKSKNIELQVDLAESNQYPERYLNVAPSERLDSLQLVSVKQGSYDLTMFCELKLQTVNDLDIESFINTGDVTVSELQRQPIL